MAAIAAPLTVERIGRALGPASPEQLAAASPPGSGRAAAVAAILRQPAPDAEAEVLFIRRAEFPGDPWSGHMAFPGGRRDPEDPHLFHTAIRETREEIGLDLPGTARALGALPPIEAVARGRRVGMTISPFVFELVTPAPLSPNHEVAELLWAPLGPLLRGERETQKPYVWEERTIYLPGYDVSGHVVWGLTHQMLGVLARRLTEAG